MILELLKRIATSLDDKGIQYMLSGSLALNKYTVPRMTADIDIVIELNRENSDDFLLIFKDGYYLNEASIRDEIRYAGMFNIIDHKTGFKVDFIIRKNTEYRKAEFNRRVKTQISDIDIWMVTAEDLIISKIDWIQQLQSEKQMNDIKKLFSRKDIDTLYIRSWCEKLKLQTFNLLNDE